MKVYISGISGTGMGPLALMAHDAGLDVCGSDLTKGAVYDELVKAGIEVEIGKQDGKYLKKQLGEGVDWFVYTSALPENHVELKLAQEAGVKCTKRDDFTKYLVEKLGLKMVAVAGTHGKTTTTAMIVWLALKLKLPVSYVVGTTLGFAPSGAYHSGDEYFIYEADEYDRNFLKFNPWLAVITTISYDHSDIYKSEAEYKKAFRQFINQSGQVLKSSDTDDCREIKLSGKVRRQDAGKAVRTIEMIYQDRAMQGYSFDAAPRDKLFDMISGFPGVGRRFERIADGVYTDYAHHPEEIKATLDVAQEEAALCNKKGVVVVYQPHQNVRQYEVRDGYREAFGQADKVYWLPTYLTREDPELAVLTPEELVQELMNAEVAEVAELDDALEMKLKEHLASRNLVVLMTAGPADDWLREKFSTKKVDLF